MELLIKKGAAVDAKKPGYTPLSWAIWRNHKDVMRVLITHGADVNFRSDDWPFLHYAVWNNDKDMVELFVDHGAKLDVKDKSGWTVLHYAANQGYKEIVEYLVGKGADVKVENNDGRTPLLLLPIQEDHKGMFELLQKHMLAHNIAVTNVMVPSSCAQGDTVPISIRATDQLAPKELATPHSHFPSGDHVTCWKNPRRSRRPTTSLVASSAK